jgi:hypothetical protein
MLWSGNSDKSLIPFGNWRKHTEKTLRQNFPYSEIREKYSRDSSRKTNKNEIISSYGIFYSNKTGIDKNENELVTHELVIQIY